MKGFPMHKTSALKTKITDHPSDLGKSHNKSHDEGYFDENPDKHTPHKYKTESPLEQFSTTLSDNPEAYTQKTHAEHRFIAKTAKKAIKEAKKKSTIKMKSPLEQGMFGPDQGGSGTIFNPHKKEEEKKEDIEMKKRMKQIVFGKTKTK